jgi:hypothetical protein
MKLQKIVVWFTFPDQDSQFPEKGKCSAIDPDIIKAQFKPLERRGVHISLAIIDIKGEQRQTGWYGQARTWEMGLWDFESYESEYTVERGWSPTVKGTGTTECPSPRSRDFAYTGFKPQNWVRQAASE